MRQLSSRWTALQKVVLPAVWIPLSAALVFFLFSAPAGPEARSRVVAWLLLAATAVTWVVLYRFGVCLRKVAIAGDVLVVADFGREIHVPLREVAGVTGSLGLRPEVVWVRFRHPTPFGNRIVFMPEPRPLGGFTRHPMVEELRALVAAHS